MAHLLEELAGLEPEHPQYEIRRSRRTGSYTVRDRQGKSVFYFTPAELDEKLEELGGRPLVEGENGLFEVLFGASLQEREQGRRPRGVHAARGRSGGSQHVKYAAGWTYLWVRARKRDSLPQAEFRRLHSWVRKRKPADWDHWTEMERNWAVTAAAVTRAFDFKALGLEDPLRPFTAGGAPLEAFYRRHIRTHLKALRRLVRRSPRMLETRWVRADDRWHLMADSAYLRRVLSACEEIVTL